MSDFSFSIDIMPMYDEYIDPPVGIVQKANYRGRFHIEVWSPDEFTGELRWNRNIDFDNGITTEGANSLLGVGFHADTQITAWYLFPISNTSYSALSSADTAASHGGWIESAAYSETTRVAWSPGAPSGGSLLNGTPAVMTVSADGTDLVGMGVASVSTKSSTSGKLWATGLFGSVQNMNTGDVLKITYTVTLTPTS